MRFKKFEYQSHTADVEFLAYGRSFEKVLGNSILAMANTIANTRRINADARKWDSIKVYHIKLTERSEKGSYLDLLWYVLQDALSIADYRGLFIFRVSSIEMHNGKTKDNVRVELDAVKKQDKYSYIEVKGVSKYNMSLKFADGVYKADIVIDV
ncbi:archease [Candidatus Mancarchaeum acidiphilum]|uniref:Archease n=1 Tax=Candidatus Mancarchaeum acidiphilum TaxID=1920749 RepID=A0A218NLV8_9ARCH|nr:archease [Candidatus Mancarchaeum acidiphilum]ASI13448.1 archease [Candidatus Mancarchaeum acidiphilum]